MDIDNHHFMHKLKQILFNFSLPKDIIVMKIIEILETDHVAIRLLDRCISEEMDVESFKSFHDFIVGLHAKIEDEVLFPAFKEAYKDSDEVLYLVDRLYSDHLLLKKLGEKIIEYGESGELSLYKKRLERYMIILIDHNRSEEKLLFPLWKYVDEKIREEAEKYHELVSKYADDAQEEHEKMMALFEEADSLRRQADEAQEKFIEAKLKSDEEHRMFLEEMKNVNEFDKILSGLRHKKSAKGGVRKESENMERAREIYEKFKNGEKLSTEDLMLLQKSGFL